MIAAKESELSVGVRAIHESVFDQRIDEATAAVVTGTIREDDIRTGTGLSGFVHQRTDFTERFSVTAGTRIELIGFERDIRHGRYSGLNTDTSLVASSSLISIIPGAGFNYNHSPHVGFFGGIHRGYAPPRVKDAISTDGVASNWEQN